MTAPLYDVKNKFSEYVSLAQQGQIIEVQKYGKSAVVILDAEEYNRIKSKKSEPTGSYKDWRLRWENLLASDGDAEMDVFWNAIERRKSRSTRKNPFLDM